MVKERYRHKRGGEGYIFKSSLLTLLTKLINLNNFCQLKKKNSILEFTNKNLLVAFPHLPPSLGPTSVNGY